MKVKKFSTDIETLEREVEITFYKSSGPGGQRKNKRETAVRIYHPLSKITVIATEHRSQAKNRMLALQRLKEKLEALNKERKPRIPTEMPISVRKSILEEKRRHAEKKKRRAKISLKEEEWEA